MSNGDSDGVLARSGSARRKRSAWWFLLPVLLGLPGGIIAWFILRRDDPPMASICLWFGVALVVLGLVVDSALGGVVLPPNDVPMHVWR